MRAATATPVRGPAPLDLGRVVEARERGDLGERADVVAALDLPHRRDDGRRPDAVADPEARQPVELRERSQREHVVSCRGRDRRSRRSGRPDRGSRSTPRRSPAGRAPAGRGRTRSARRAGTARPGRVVRGRDEEQPRARRDRRSHRREVDPTGGVERHQDRHGVALLRVADEARERRPRHDHLVARVEDGLADVADQRRRLPLRRDLRLAGRRAGRRAPRRASPSLARGSGSGSSVAAAIAASAEGNGPLRPSLSPRDATPGARPGIGSPGGICSSDGRTNREPSLTSRQARVPAPASGRARPGTASRAPPAPSRPSRRHHPGGGATRTGRRPRSAPPSTHPAERDAACAAARNDRPSPATKPGHGGRAPLADQPPQVPPADRHRDRVATGALRAQHQRRLGGR